MLVESRKGRRKKAAPVRNPDCGVTIISAQRGNIVVTLSQEKQKAGETTLVTSTGLPMSLRPLQGQVQYPVEYANPSLASNDAQQTNSRKSRLRHEHTRDHIFDRLMECRK